jgi:hypothetical protein
MGYEIGIDGYPLDPRPAEEQERERQRAFYRQINRLERRWRAGDLVAPSEAAQLCRHYQQPPPKWLVDAVTRLINERMSDAEKRDRHAFAIHFTRWEAVKELRERRDQLLEEHGDDRGKRWEKIWRHVADALGCKEETVRSSYRLIKAAGGEHATLESYRCAVRKK